MAASANAATFSWNAISIGHVAGISDFSAERAMIDVTVLGSNQFRSFIAGRRTATFSVDLILTYASPGNHDDIMDDFKTGVERTFSLDFRDGKVSGSGILQSLSFGAQQDNASTLSISVQVTTDLTFAATT